MAITERDAPRSAQVNEQGSSTESPAGVTGGVTAGAQSASSGRRARPTIAHGATFLIQRVARLGFEDTEAVVAAFLERRLRHHGIAAWSLVDDALGSTAADLDANIDANLDAGPRFVVVASLLNPFTDIDAVDAAIETMLDEGWPAARIVGAVPGTQPDLIVDAHALGGRSIRDAASVARDLRWPTQDRFNNQVNLFKHKRMKMFRFLVDEVDDLHALSVPQMLERFNEPPLRTRLLSYGAPVEVQPVSACPHCGGGRLTPLPARASQPLIGFLPPDSAVYQLCEGCGLGFLDPQIDPDSTHLLYDAWDYQDGVVNLPDDDGSVTVCSKQQTTLARAARHLPDQPAVLDLGGGLGTFARYVKQTHPDWHVTHSDFDVRSSPALTESGVETRTLNFLAEPIGNEAYDLITAFEVIEHLPFAGWLRTVRNVHRALRPGGVFALTTPDLDSPLVRAFDFYNGYVPHHLLLFGHRWLTAFFSDPVHGFDLAEVASASDVLDDYESYFAYCEQTAPGFQQRAGATLMRTVLGDPAVHRRLLEQNMGTEVVLVLRKRTADRTMNMLDEGTT
jgi:SAM-dependent methyltransferase